MNVYKSLPHYLKLFPIKQASAPLAIALLAIVFNILNDVLIGALGYNANLINNGELWRLITGHLLHTNTAHLLLNLAGLVLLWSLHGQYYNVKSYLAIFISCSLLTSIMLYFFSPDLVKYVGLSGVLHSVFVIGAVKDIQHNMKSGYLLLIGVAAKITHEQVYGADSEISSLIAADVAIDAHLFGAVSGIVYLAILFLIRKSNAK